MSQGQSSEEYDVIVVGSGAGAAAAAVRAADHGFSVLMVEKSEYFGGTSAISGGGLWVPNNHKQAKHGIQDDYEKALTYLRAATKGEVPEARLRAYLDNSPKMVRWLEEKTPVRYALVPRYSDYYPHLPGALPGGRSLDPELFDLTRLGENESWLRPPSATLLFGKMAMTSRDAGIILNKRGFGPGVVMRAFARYYLDIGRRLKTPRDRMGGLGNALMGGMFKALLDRKVPMWLKTDFQDFIFEDGRVCGIVVRREGREVRVRCRRGVIIGSGGFEQNEALRRKYLPSPTRAEWSTTPSGVNTGAALEAAMRIGADTAMLDLAWWVPTIAFPDNHTSVGVFVNRSQPGSIAVNKQGRRFVDEAGPYLEFVAAMYEDNERNGGGCVPAWFVFDATYRRKYAMGPLMPATVCPDRPRWENTLYWKANSIEELAGKIGVDAAGLADTVKRFNEYARTGKDLEFDKGGNVYDRYYGDSTVKPNPCLAPIIKAPFYAMRADAGDTGTKGGILTDECARALDKNGQPIPGLYAVGNCSASVMGNSYPGAGSTLGPAMTFGYIAANHIAGELGARSGQPQTVKSVA